ncbi:NADH-quinone oxidoreductase subunit K [Thiohalophilus sp.]|uniref:NADH-quinone oxidoreductase subunit K n=1 Tax=Thiohalophilus sp. TaxID=3028392 RepID=UPI002ACEE471|nr:NADH-quinone oxidoreductase subunit K [Thiohalophilus sp.]MDZ7803919.1 NADH-quinone oxidoreductase subunit K [Thiohalophilus sp.]
MNSLLIYTLTGAGLFTLGLYALIVHAHLLRKILAINVMSSGVFLLLVTLARSSGDPTSADPVPQAMVITGIVVAVSATALALLLMLKLHRATGRAHLPGDHAK